MAVVADIDGFDLWVEPHDLTREESEELRRFILEHRQKHPLSEGDKQAVLQVVERLRAQTEPVPSRERSRGVAG